ncbi:hypothetical protein PINS_up013353 [Pythium insidiosum]|nr:hypothetical protein PINS_up013353 [Pythium insidiosum]
MMIKFSQLFPIQNVGEGELSSTWAQYQISCCSIVNDVCNFDIPFSQLLLNIDQF